jgi:hypothetical protein
LVHASRVMDVGVHLPDIVKVSVRYLLGVGDFFILIKERLQIVTAFQIL